MLLLTCVRFWIMVNEPSLMVTCDALKKVPENVSCGILYVRKEWAGR